MPFQMAAHDMAAGGVAPGQAFPPTPHDGGHAGHAFPNAWGGGGGIPAMGIVIPPPHIHMANNATTMVPRPPNYPPWVRPPIVQPAANDMAAGFQIAANFANMQEQFDAMNRRMDIIATMDSRPTS